VLSCDKLNKHKEKFPVSFINKRDYTVNKKRTGADFISKHNSYKWYIDEFCSEVLTVLDGRVVYGIIKGYEYWYVWVELLEEGSEESFVYFKEHSDRDEANLDATYISNFLKGVFEVTVSELIEYVEEELNFELWEE